MSRAIAAPSAVHTPAVTSPEHADQASHAPKKSRDLDLAAREFEQIFVRSMLKNTPMAGKGDVYGDLAVDAMAKNVTEGRGLGLGELIKRAVEKSENSLKDRK